MANLTPTPEENADVMQWDGVTPLAGGGPTAPLNRQAQALLNRIKWLRDHMLSVSDTNAAAAAIASGRNHIINPTFSINQRTFAGGARTAGQYGHDRWKAGTAGCTYTVSGELATITAGSLLQIIEGTSVPEGGTYTLSWEGTAQARVDGGSYASSPITVTGKTASTNTTVEFGIGTLTKVQYESGSLVTKFERRPITSELHLCQRYFWVQPHNIQLEGYGGGLGANSYMNVLFPVRMRATPTVTLTWGGMFNVFSVSTATESADGYVLRVQSASPGSFGGNFLAGATANAEL